MALPYYENEKTEPTHLTINTTTDTVTDISTGNIIYDTITDNLMYADNNTFVTLDYVNDATAPGAYLTYNDSSMSWTTTTVQAKVFYIFENDEIKIDDNGTIFVNDKEETNPSKIGLALLRAVQKIKESNKQMDSINDICDV